MAIKAYGELTLTQVNDGENGVPGANGYTHFAYATGANGEGFSKSWFAEATYIGTYSDHTEADSEDYTKYKWNKIKGEKGEKGDSPVFVSVGNDSQNIPCDSSGKTLTAMIIHIPFKGYKGTTECPCTATVMSTLPKDGMTSTIDTANSEVLLNITKGATLDGAFSGSVQIKFTVNGEKDLYKYFTWNKTTDGVDGKDAVIYELMPSVNVIKKGENNVLSPASITFSAYKTIGNDTHNPYSGQFIISEYLPSKGRYVTKYTSQQSETVTQEYAPTSDATLIKCELYVWNKSILLDSQTVTIISDFDSVKNTLSEVRQSYVTVSGKVNSIDGEIKNTIKKTDEITVKDKEGNDVSKTYEQLIVDNTQNINGIGLTVEKNKKDADGEFTQVKSMIKQNEDSINFIVNKNNEDGSIIGITPKAIDIISKNITIKGNTLIQSVGTDPNGTTTINDLVSKDGSLQSTINQNGEQINSLRHDADGLTGLFKRVGMGVGADNNYKQVESTTKVTVNGDGLTVTGNADSDDQINTTIMNGVYGTNKSGQDIFHLDQEGCHTGRVYMDRGYEVGMEKTNGDIAGMKMVPQLMMDNAGHQIACMCFVVPGGNS